MSVSTAKRPSPLEAVARALAVDATIAEVTAAWRATGVASLLLKGPTVAGWLYRDGSVRSYGDADLLVAPDRVADAEAGLLALGFVALAPDSTHAVPWWRERDGARVDLHHRLWAASAPPMRVWATIARDATTTMRVAGADVAVPTVPLRALLVATHAAQHETDSEKPLEDLRRALITADEDVWRAAATLADTLGLLRPMADGLGRSAAGHAVAARLPLVRVLDGLDARARGEVVVGIARVAAAHGAAAKLRVGVRAAFPPRDVLRWWSPLARRGRGGLAAAYAARAGHLVVRALPALVSWRRLRA